MAVISSQLNNSHHLLFHKAKDKTLRFVFALLFSIVLMVCDSRSHYLNFIRSGFSVLVAPLRYVVDYPVRCFNWVESLVTTKKALIDENMQLHYQQTMLAAELQKLKSTYVDALPALISPKTGRIHTSFMQAVTATGRLSSKDPNLQNIPIRTVRGREIRKAFIPRDENHLILSADYSQIELRIMAAFSKDESMLDAFNNGLDVHKATAAKVFHVPLEEVTSDMRRKAKTVNFGIIYGVSAFGLAAQLGISRTEAKEIIDQYFIEFPKVKTFMDQSIADARENGYVETVLGRRRYLRDILSANMNERGFAERNAINAPIQGSAADMIKVAMIQIQDFLEKENLQSKMILTVHDELVFDAHKDEVDYLKTQINKIMCEAMDLGVAMETGIGVGENWLEAH